MGDEVAYDPEALPNSLEVEQLRETRALSDRLDELDGHLVGLATQSEGGAASVMSVDDAQWDVLLYDVRAANTLSMLVLVLLGVCVGLVAWDVFSRRWV